MTRPVQMHVHPSFRKKLRMAAVEEDKPVTKLTEELAKDSNFLGNVRHKNDKKKRSFDFGF